MKPIVQIGNTAGGIDGNRGFNETRCSDFDCHSTNMLCFPTLRFLYYLYFFSQIPQLGARKLSLTVAAFTAAAMLQKLRTCQEAA